MKKLVLNESAFDVGKEHIKHSVYEAVLGIISDATSDLDVEINRRVPGYNPDWSAEESIEWEHAFDLTSKLAMVFTNLLCEQM